MRRVVLTTAGALCACSVLPSAAGAANVTDLLAASSATSAVAVLGAPAWGVVAQAERVEQVPVSAYPRSVSACVSKRTGRHRVEKAVDRIVRATTTTRAGEATPVTLGVPRVKGVLRCR